MEKLPRISIITPSYNQGQYIEQTIQSILSQDYPDLEYLVVDGGSSDNTIDILKRYEDQLSWTSGKDRGQTHAINMGFQQTSGDVISFINSDDCLETGALHKVGKFFLNHPHAYWVTGKCRIVDRNDHEIRKIITVYKNFWLEFHDCQILKVINFISQPATFWRRQVNIEIGDLDEKLVYTMDYDYWLRISKRYELNFLNSYLARFRIHPQSKSGLSFSGLFDAEYLTAKEHVSSQFYLFLHKIHSSLAKLVYMSLLRNLN